MFVGGEFYYEQHWLANQPALDTDGMVFLNGGRACLTVIGDYLRENGINQILLPTYLCPSILDALERIGLAWDFYRVNEDLSIDTEILLKKSTANQAIYFINYFGFFNPPETLTILKSLQKNGLIIIEDNAQAGFAGRITGDFYFNSLRKLVPYDGGYLGTNLDIAPFLQKYRDLPNLRLPLIREYRKLLRDYLIEEKGSYKCLVNLYARAESHYASDMIVTGDDEEQRAIERLDWAGIRQTRRENYHYLLDCISEIPEITPLFPILPAEVMPLGLPIYFNGISRDTIYDFLGENSIGLFIHWEELRHDPRTNADSLAISMASRMLTLAIDQQTSLGQIDYQVLMLKEGIAKASRSS